MDMDVFEIAYYASTAAAILLIVDMLGRFGMFRKYIVEFTLLVVFYIMAAAFVYNAGVMI